MGYYGSVVDSVSVIDSSTNTVTATIAVGTYPMGISVSPDGSKIYVADVRSNEVSVINTATNTVEDTIKVGGYPEAFGNFISSHICTVGITSQSMLSAISVYPNPATDNITIESPQKSRIEILNIQGQTIMQRQIQPASLASRLRGQQGGQGKTDIDISTLAKGVYILRLCSNDKIAVTRIVKE
jgi:YVTN family beta-propeller protein